MNLPPAIDLRLKSHVFNLKSDSLQLPTSPAATSGMVVPPQSPGGDLTTPRRDTKEVCARCGSESIVGDFEYVPGLGRQTYRKCMACGHLNQKFVGVAEGPDPMTQRLNDSMTQLLNDQYKEEEIMKKEDKRTCSIEGCEKCGSFDGMCVSHFRQVHGMTYREYLRRRNAGEAKEEILAHPKTGHRGGDRKSEKAKEAHSSLPKIEVTKSDSKIMEVAINFKAYPELAEKLSRIAHANFRWEGNEILHMIAEAHEPECAVKAP